MSESDHRTILDYASPARRAKARASPVVTIVAIVVPLTLILLGLCVFLSFSNLLPFLIFLGPLSLLAFLDEELLMFAGGLVPLFVFGGALQYAIYLMLVLWPKKRRIWSVIAILLVHLAAVIIATSNFH
jgi:hypothetical protein